MNSDRVNTSVEITAGHFYLAEYKWEGKEGFAVSNIRKRVLH